ncbi:hypothetical protein FPF71_07765 [Algibacter amylolyticus]|uniref:Uncharacterized protein n=1 Tax=Algibacter amylolyticus TaxID=1608400 RepID=A0A5M7BC80_9FLAO|nr:hypothetical protein [Algibacter amylolyticus]KAA5825084.1 hypothetical protein F2B50_07765 [Algibacter amylolyticus]MBB5268810.1 hypothetical protein [Algibacter amylolyticus]TSJ77578.1 hypothetical protein FPF71_07765 [Algibacter amylolyticus]
MIARWCISILIFSLTLFGAVSQQQMVVANQEIVLQFQDADLTTYQTEKTVAALTLQLQDLGAQKIQVLSKANGTLKITYYSDADITHIKQTLAKESQLSLKLTTQDKNSSQFPFNDSDVSYYLDVYEIHKGQDSGWDFDGAISLEVKVKSDRFLDPNFLSVGYLAYSYQENLLQVAYINRREVAIQLSSPLHTIPEVRAGPKC